MKSHVHFFAIALLFLNGVTSNAQSVAINTDGSTADPSALLDLKSDNQGILVPRMTASQRGLIATPATGLMVYQTDAPAGFFFYNGTAWTSLNGTNGSNGQGVPAGGTTGQVLSKVDGTNFNTEWKSLSSGGATLQLYANSTLTQSKFPYGYSRYLFNFNNTLSVANTEAWTSSNTYTIPAGMGGLYQINLSMVLTSAGGFITPPNIHPEIQVTSNGNKTYFYGAGSTSSNLLQGDASEATAVASPGNPISIGRSNATVTIPLLAGDSIKIYYRSSMNSNCQNCQVGFSTDGSSYLSIVKLN